MADKDARLKCGDQLLDVNGTSLKDCTQQSALQALRQTLPKVYKCSESRAHSSIVSSLSSNNSFQMG